MKKIKKFLIILTLLMLGITIYEIADTYALFQSEILGIQTSNIGKWNIFINESDIVNGTVQEFTIDTFNIDASQYTKSGKIAPGMQGNFEIEILPGDTQVSIRYDITIDDSELNNNQMELVGIEETNNEKIIIKTAPNTYTAVILLEDIIENYKDTIKIHFMWENKEINNESDTAIGKVYNSKVEVPITVCVSQYLGETIQEYIIEEEI